MAASTDSFVESLETSVVITSSDAFPFDVVMIFVDMLASIIVDVCPPYVVMDLVDIPAIKVVKDCAGVKVAVVAKLFADVSPGDVVTITIFDAPSVDTALKLVGISTSEVVRDLDETSFVDVVMESVDTPASTAVDSCWDVKTEVTIKASADVSLDEGVTVIVDASSLKVSMTLACISASLVVKV